MTLFNKNRAISKFWTNKAFRQKVLDAAAADGVVKSGINPDNLAAILKFLMELLPYILKLFVP